MKNRQSVLMRKMHVRGANSKIVAKRDVKRLGISKALKNIDSLIGKSVFKSDADFYKNVKKRYLGRE